MHIELNGSLHQVRVGLRAQRVPVVEIEFALLSSEFAAANARRHKAWIFEKPQQQVTIGRHKLRDWDPREHLYGWRRQPGNAVDQALGNAKLQRGLFDIDTRKLPHQRPAAPIQTVQIMDPALAEQSLPLSLPAEKNPDRTEWVFPEAMVAPADALPLRCLLGSG
ncbi:hypothetical protein C7S18_20910 [Ahniella affigens]|uniref:Uncharacterized protein n=1 Tax=Ahniella affigens TaxID=2021234 RepID=A0A2P1PXC2_9GAMM|nr:hypothetical protein C7S18_20910 [Ahniella affigens]